MPFSKCEHTFKMVSRSCSEDVNALKSSNTAPLVACFDDEDGREDSEANGDPIPVNTYPLSKS